MKLACKYLMFFMSTIELSVSGMFGSSLAEGSTNFSSWTFTLTSFSSWYYLWRRSQLS